MLDAIRQVMEAEAERQGKILHVLDPFAGVGGIHDLADDRWNTYGVELEPEWAHQHPRTRVGDATALEWGDDSVDVVATSPCYGNRMADTYDGRGRCRAEGCEDGVIERLATPEEVDDGREFGIAFDDCERCQGTGRDQSARMTYRIKLGRMPSSGSSAVMQWGDAYREFHGRAWAEALRVLRPRGLAVINISNHMRTVGSGKDRRKVEMRVVEWHLDWWIHHGFTVETIDRVGTRRYGFGANRDSRVDAERLLVLRAPA